MGNIQYIFFSVCMLNISLLSFAHIELVDKRQINHEKLEKMMYETSLKSFDEGDIKILKAIKGVKEKLQHAQLFVAEVESVVISGKQTNYFTFKNDGDIDTLISKIVGNAGTRITWYYLKNS